MQHRIKGIRKGKGRETRLETAKYSPLFSGSALYLRNDGEKEELI